MFPDGARIEAGEPMEPEVTVILGVGPGLSAAVAERFAAAGHALALLSRSARHHRALAATIRTRGATAQGYDCDAADPASIAAAFARIRNTLGHPTGLIYTAGSYMPGGILELDGQRFETAWRVNCLGAFLAAREVLPAMLQRECGRLLFTGATASRRGSAGFAGLAVGKFGLRALAQSLAHEFGPRGIHVAHCVIDGQIDSPALHERQPGRAAATCLNPHAVAEAYWQVYRQPPSAWTLELDLRPHLERF